MSRFIAQSTWLLPFLRQVDDHLEQRLELGPPMGSEQTFEVWLNDALDERGFGRGFPADLWPGPERPGAPSDEGTDYILLNALFHQCDLAADVFLRAGIPYDRSQFTLLQLIALAEELSDGEGELSRRAWALRDHESGPKQTKAANSVASSIGEALRRRAVDSSSPLMGHPFQQILMRQDTLLGARIAQAVAWAVTGGGGRIDPLRVLKAQGLCQVAQLQAIDAVIGLAAADGALSGIERDLIDAMADACALDDLQREVIDRALESPRSPQSLADEVRDPGDRLAIYREVALSALLDGRTGDAEHRYLDQLGAAFELDPSTLDRIELNTTLYLSEHPELREAFSLGGAFARMKSALSDRMESLVADSASDIMAPPP